MTYSKKRIIKNNESKKHLLNSLKSYHDEKWLYPYAIFMWIGDNANAICRVASKFHGRPIFSVLGEFNYCVKKRFNEVIVEMHVAWSYWEDGKKPPSMKTISKFLNNIHVRELFSKTDTDRQHAVITLDLAKWNNIVYGILHQSLYAYCIGVSELNKTPTCLLSEIKVILHRFFPYLNMDFLLAAIEIEPVTENVHVFIEWFDTLCKSTVTNKVTLANDFV